MTLNPPLKLIAGMLSKRHTDTTEATEARIQRHVNADNRRCYQLGVVSNGEVEGEGKGEGSVEGKAEVFPRLTLHYAPPDTADGKAGGSLNNAQFLKTIKALKLPNLDLEFKNKVIHASQPRLCARTSPSNHHLAPLPRLRTGWTSRAHASGTYPSSHYRPPTLPRAWKRSLVERSSH